MKNIAWTLLFMAFGAGLYFVFGYPAPSIPSGSQNIATQENSSNLDEKKPLDSKSETINKELNSNSREVITIIQNNSETNSNTNVESISLDEQLKDLQKLTSMDLSKLEEGLKYALLNGTAEITPEGHISYGMDSTYVSDMQAHPHMADGLSLDEYFTQDSNSMQWARDTENQIAAALSNPKFIKQFSDLSVYDFSCKDTICRVSFSGRALISSRLTEHFTYIPSLGTHYGGRSTSVDFDDDGNTHVYVYRNMIKESEH